MHRFTEVLERCVDDRELRLRHARAAYGRAVRLAWQAKASKLMAIYEWVTGQRSVKAWFGVETAPPAEVGCMRRELGVWALVLAAPVLGALACNAVVGVGAVAVMGGVGYFAGQCYDRVHIRVRDAQTGRTTCAAEVSVAEADGGGRSVRPCYNVALTEGHWQLVAKIPGYVPASAQVEVPERRGSCPYYTHTVELTLQREGVPRAVAERAPVAAAVPVAAALPRAPARPPFGLMPITSPAVAAPVAPPAAATSESPGVPTRSFAPPPAPDAGAPR